jgi:hypothetical protein
MMKYYNTFILCFELLKHIIYYVMNYPRPVFGLLLCTFICSRLLGQSIGAPLAVRALIQRADPQANVVYCGAVSTGKVDYYLFYLERKELAGVVLVQQRTGAAPVIADADTSLFPFQDDSVQKPLQDAIERLLRRWNRAPQGTSGSRPEISAVGREIDRVIYPIAGFRLGSNSTREILRLLRTGPTRAVAPGTAPPGSIIVSPTKFSSSGPIYLGHAGIVGWNGSIYSADARYAGARTKNFSLTTWLRRFSGTNGSYAFVLHTPSNRQVEGFQ